MGKKGHSVHQKRIQGKKREHPIRGKPPFRRTEQNMIGFHRKTCPFQADTAHRRTFPPQKPSVEIQERTCLLSRCRSSMKHSPGRSILRDLQPQRRDCWSGMINIARLQSECKHGAWSHAYLR
eukprot:3192396-Rhodomonas_salina.2